MKKNNFLCPTACQLPDSVTLPGGIIRCISIHYIDTGLPVVLFLSLHKMLDEISGISLLLRSKNYQAKKYISV